MSAVFGPIPGISVSFSFASKYGSLKIFFREPSYCWRMILDTSMILGPFNV
jgi:hypothetical protein